MKVSNFSEICAKFIKIEPDIGHCGCMVNLFSRAGLFDKAEEKIGKMLMKPDAVM